MKNLLPLAFAVALVLPVLFRRRLRLIITVDATTDITTGATTTDTSTTGATIGTGDGLAPPLGAAGIIAIGRRWMSRRVPTTDQ